MYEKKEVEQIGQWLTTGFLRELGKLVIITLVLISVFQIVPNPFPTDDTDASSTRRSGMSLKTDYGTGCQYLQSTHGNLTPRLDVNGEPICGLEGESPHE